MPQFYPTLVRLFQRLNLACAVAGAAILFMVAGIIFLEVTLRSLTGESRLWVIEVSEYSLLFITFLGAPYLLEKNMHVTLDLLYDSLPPARRRIAMLVNALLGLFVCVVLTIVGIGVLVDQIGTGVRETTVMAPQSFWFTSALPLGMGLMGFQFFDQAVRAIQGREL